MPVSIFMLLVPLALAAGTALYLWWVRQVRDRVCHPAEAIWGDGPRKALLIYQPSRRGAGTRAAKALAQALAAAGHTVTMNHPSPALRYRPEDYDLLIFGGSAYLGRVGRPLVDYLTSLRFSGKRVLLYVLGEWERSPELATLRLCVPAGNEIRTIKRKATETGVLAQFALAERIP